MRFSSIVLMGLSLAALARPGRAADGVPCRLHYHNDYVLEQTIGPSKNNPMRTVTRSTGSTDAGVFTGTLTYFEGGDEDVTVDQSRGTRKYSQYIFNVTPTSQAVASFQGTYDGVSTGTEGGGGEPHHVHSEWTNSGGSGIRNFGTIGFSTTGRGDGLFPNGFLESVATGGPDISVHNYDSIEHDVGNRRFHDWTDGPPLGPGPLNPFFVQEADALKHLPPIELPHPPPSNATPAQIREWMQARQNQTPRGYPAPAFRISHKAIHDAIASGKAAVVTGSEEFSVTQDDGSHLSGSITVTLAINPAEIDAILEPIDLPGYPKYDDWIPKGKHIVGNSADDPASDKERYLADRGNSIMIGTKLVDRNHPDDPPKDIQYQVRYTIDDVSKQPGLCMNYPLKDADEKPDLRFLQDENEKYGTLDDPSNPTVLTTKAEVPGDSPVWVTSFDYGAYGTIRAEVLIDHQVAYEAHLSTARGGKYTMPLPRDDNKNHIADAWEKAASQKIFEKNYPATWDGEKNDTIPVPGDGLTLYEEYRGFIVLDQGTDREYMRLPPGKDHPGTPQMKLFICPDDPRNSETQRVNYVAGSMLYAQVTKVTVYFVSTQDLQDGPGSGHPTWVNFNAHTGDGKDFGKKQAAVRIEFEDASTMDDPIGHTDPWDPNNTGSIPPWDTKRVRMTETPAWMLIEKERDDIAHSTITEPAPANDYYGWFLAWRNPVLDPKNVTASMDIGGVVRRKTIFAVCHEIGHATGAQHHGVEPAAYAAGVASWPIDHPGVDFNDQQLQYDLAGKGEPTCPMFYWDRGNARYLIPYYTKRWDPSMTAWVVGPPAPHSFPTQPFEPLPWGDPKDWKFCDVDRKR